MIDKIKVVFIYTIGKGETQSRTKPTRMNAMQIYTLNKNINAPCKIIAQNVLNDIKWVNIGFMCTQWLFLLSCLAKACGTLSIRIWYVVELIPPSDRCDMSTCWSHPVTNTQTLPILGTIKGHPKMFKFIKRHNATDVTSHERTCSWHAECWNVHQSGFHTVQRSLSDYQPFETSFQRLWQHCKSTARPATTCDHEGTRRTHPAPAPAESS